jgi:hypothetical protein
MQQAARYAFGLLGSSFLLAAASYADYYRQLHIPCGDCFVEFGLPFKFWMEGGFAGARLFMWGGLLADIGVIVTLAVAMGWTWGRMGSK